MDATEISRTSEGIFGQACRYHRPERGRDSDEFTELSKQDSDIEFVLIMILYPDDAGDR